MIQITSACVQCKRNLFVLSVRSVWGYVFKASSVQAVLNPMFENVSVQCENKFFRTYHLFFYESERCVRVCLQAGSWVQTVPQSIFQNINMQCEKQLFVSTTCFWCVITECGIPYVLKFRSVQTVPQSFFENVNVQGEDEFFSPNNCFLWVIRMYQHDFFAQ